MADFVLTHKAIEDLTDIWNYSCDTWSEEQADKYYLQLLNYCQQLADKKLIARYYPEIDIDLLGYKAGQHLIFFRKISGEKIEIIRILHARMDLKNRLTEQ
jgi:toxin ParE1/3/4